MPGLPISASTPSLFGKFHWEQSTGGPLVLVLPVRFYAGSKIGQFPLREPPTRLALVRRWVVFREKKLMCREGMIERESIRRVAWSGRSDPRVWSNTVSSVGSIAKALPADGMRSPSAGINAPYTV